MEFKKDKTYTFPQMMAYGFTKENDRILADCHLYLGENSFEAVLEVTEAGFRALIRKSDDKTGGFEKICTAWLSHEAEELFLPDSFPEPVHCKLTGMAFHFVKSELEEDEFGEERIFHFAIDSAAA